MQACEQSVVDGHKWVRVVGIYVRQALRRRVSSVVEHSSANPNVPIPGLVSYQGHGL